MARLFTPGTDRLTLANNPTATVFSFSLWTNRVGTANPAHIASKYNPTGNVEDWASWHDNASSRYYFESKWSTTNGKWYVARPTGSVWHQWGIGYDGGATTNDPDLVTDGAIGTETEEATPAGTRSAIDAVPIYLGGRSNGDLGWDGHEAEFGYWNRKLSADEWALLGKGYSPLFLPDGLIEYVPIIRELVSVKNAAPTATGTAVSDHPRIFLPAWYKSGTPPAAAAIAPAALALTVTLPAPVVALAPTISPALLSLGLTLPAPTVASGVVASDSFTRTASNWGSADIGGAWTHRGSASAVYTTDGSRGKVTDNVGGSLSASGLRSLSIRDLDMRSKIDFDTKNGRFYVTARVNGTNEFLNCYLVYFRVDSTNLIIVLEENHDTGGVFVSTQQLASVDTGRPSTANTQYTVRIQVEGATPTRIKAKVWPTSDTEPVAWDLSFEDSQAVLQDAGWVALGNRTDTSAPTAYRFDDFIVSTFAAVLPIVVPASLSLGLTINAPEVVKQAISPALLSLGLTIPTPTVVDNRVSPALIALVLTLPAPRFNFSPIEPPPLPLGPPDPVLPAIALTLVIVSPSNITSIPSPQPAALALDLELLAPVLQVFVTTAPRITVAQALRLPHQRLARVSLLAADLTVEQVISGIAGITVSGTVSTSSDRRRSCQLTIANPAGAWTPSVPGDAFFLNRAIKVERGLMLNGAPLYYTLGVFLIDRPVVTVNAAGASLEVSGQDRVKLASKSRFTKPTRYYIGTPVADVIRAIAQDAGMGDDLYDLDDGGKALTADRLFETGDDRWPAIVAIAADHALEVYVDAEGSLVMGPVVTAETMPAPVWTFERGAEAIMLGVTKELNDESWFNHTYVTGEAADLPPVSAEARDLNPLSPGYNPLDGSGPIGDRVDMYSSAGIRSVEQAQEVANARLLRMALVEEEITVPSVVVPFLGVGDVVEIVETLSRTNDRYLVDTLTMPLGSGAMTMTSRKVRSLAA